MILPIFQNIAGYPLDEQQQKIALENSNEVIAIAGAGSGKTMTILGRIHYLVQEKNIKESDILCISFTRKSSLSLKEKCKDAFGYDIEVKTFHRLALDILEKANMSYSLVSSDYLSYFIEEFICSPSNILCNLLADYFHVQGKDEEKAYQKFRKQHKDIVEKFVKLEITCIHLLKANGKDEKDLALICQQLKGKLFCRKKKEKIRFFQIMILLYRTYKKDLSSSQSCDLDEVIEIATKLVKENKVFLHYKQIIIDEFQDTSKLRFALIDAIKKQTNAKLLVVGDDFQSIYRFTGCDISLFLNFSTFYPQAKILKIESTYRNANELVRVAGAFVMKNKAQLPKEMHSKMHIVKPIKVVYYEKEKDIFAKLITKLVDQGFMDILVLGRNNKDIKRVLGSRFVLQDDGKIEDTKIKDITLNYLTVHKAKGLECETVVLLHLENSADGFPAQTKNPEVITYIQETKHYFPYDEERRLFYVALTRTKKNIYLLTSKSNPSCFVKELLRDDKKDIEIYKIS